MTFHFDARGLPWRAACDALMAFGRYVEDHSGYLYIDCDPALKGEIRTLSIHAGLTDHVAFLGDLPDDERERLIRNADRSLMGPAADGRENAQLHMTHP